MSNGVFKNQYRGCRVGHSRRSPPVLRAAINGAWIIMSTYTYQRHERPHQRHVSSLLPVRVDRHTAPREREMLFGCLNIHSVAYTNDDLLDVRCENNIDVLFLVETWHDGDFVSLPRPRVEGYQVLNRPLMWTLMTLICVC